MADLTLFARRLREARENAGLKQDELAKKVGITKASISSYENQGENSKRPALDKVIDIADALGVSMDWLCGGAKAGEFILSNDPEMRFENIIKSVVYILEQPHPDVSLHKNVEVSWGNSYSSNWYRYAIVGNDELVSGFIDEYTTVMEVIKKSNLADHLAQVLRNEVIRRYKELYRQYDSLDVKQEDDDYPF